MFKGHIELKISTFIIALHCYSTICLSIRNEYLSHGFYFKEKKKCLPSQIMQKRKNM